MALKTIRLETLDTENGQWDDTSEGEPLYLSAFVGWNSDLARETLDAIRSLGVGDHHTWLEGAPGVFRVTRLS